MSINFASRCDTLNYFDYKTHKLKLPSFCQIKKLNKYDFVINYYLKSYNFVLIITKIFFGMNIILQTRNYVEIRIYIGLK